jgi:hypothetical protein
MTYDEQIKEMTITKSLQLLRDGFKSEFATFAYSDERMTDLLQELSAEFVESNVPVVDEDNQLELALMLMETVNITTYWIMIWEVKLYVGGKVFTEEVRATNRQDALDTAVARNPKARVVGVNPTTRS